MRVILALKNGTPGATRTPDTRFRKPLLYPPELQGLESIGGAGVSIDRTFELAFSLTI